MRCRAGNCARIVSSETLLIRTWRGLHHHLVDIAESPILTGLETLYHWMICRANVRRGVLVGRAVAAADVTAGEAAPQVNPPRAGFETLLTSRYIVRFYNMHRCDVLAHAHLRHSVVVPSKCSSVASASAFVLSRIPSLCSGGP